MLTYSAKELRALQRPDVIPARAARKVILDTDSGVQAGNVNMHYVVESRHVTIRHATRLRETPLVVHQLCSPASTFGHC